MYHKGYTMNYYQRIIATPRVKVVNLNEMVNFLRSKDEKVWEERSSEFFVDNDTRFLDA